MIEVLGYYEASPKFYPHLREPFLKVKFSDNHIFYARYLTLLVFNFDLKYILCCAKGWKENEMQIFTKLKKEWQGEKIIND